MPKREADGNTSAERNACGWKRSPALSIPKGADISAFTRKQIQRIEDWINALPRKTLDGLSAEEKVKRYFEDIAALKSSRRSIASVHLTLQVRTG